MKTEIYLKSQDFKFYLSMILISTLLFLGTPKRSTGMIPIVVEGYSSYYTSAFLGLYSAVFVAFILLVMGIYLVIGSVSQDYTSGVGQLLATTPIRNRNYILGKFLSNSFTLLMIDLSTIVTAIILQFYHAEVLEFELWAFFLPHILMVYPIIIFISFASIFFETYFRNNLQLVYVGYFFVVMSLISFLMINGIDLLGIGAFESFLIDNGYVTSVYGSSLLRGGLDDITFLYFTGIDITFELLIPRIAYLGISLLLFVSTLFRFDRFDPSAWKISMRKMMKKDAEVVEEIKDVVDVKYSDLTMVATSSSLYQYRILVSSEFSNYFPKSKWYLFAVGIFTIVSITTGSPNILLMAPLFIFLQVGKLFASDLSSNNQDLMLSMPQGYRKIDISRILTSLLMLAIVSSGSILARLIQSDIMGIFAIIVSISFITALAYSSTKVLRNDKSFTAIFVIWWYMALNDVPYTNFMFTSGYVFVPFYLILTVVLFIAGKIRSL